MSDKILKLKAIATNKKMETVTLHFTAQDKLALKLIANAEGKSLKGMLEEHALHYIIQMTGEADCLYDEVEPGNLMVRMTDGDKSIISIEGKNNA